MKGIIKMRIILVAAFLLCLSCKKFLNEKPDSSLAVPTTIIDLQLLMDNYSDLNTKYPVSAEFQADDYYTNAWNYLQEYQRDQYIWGGKTFDFDPSWQLSYQAINTCNVVLENVDKVSYKKNEVALVSQVKGSALFFRAFYFYGLVQIFSKPFDPNTAKDDLGIVLRSTSDFNVPSVRSNNEVTYQRIISDLKVSSELLPETRISPNRPTKGAAYGLLARAYLGMKDYTNAGIYAEKALNLKNQLMNFNELDATSSAPIERFNQEVIFPMTAGGRIASFLALFVDSTLFDLYHINDLRRNCFYHPGANNVTYFKGDYDGTGYISYDPSAYVFAGIATDEIFLIKAECLARADKVNDAMRILNELLITRWKTGTYIPFSANSINEALTHILRERRKELVFRTLRWEDLRRLQNDPIFSVTPKRLVNGQEYTLQPNSPRYVMKIPLAVIQRSGIPQNP
ncbi:RagB/SusD family nutrient uptake outer membrane protein [Pedobacter ginsengisoli]|uniref:RagB/SusD family nutrient uptake outer membrane protein n=1 Tax=Pedobacter ginsengisoli TaxID=363852 RepID=UPI00254FB7E6|nr:RagB/SusD family nutrient uptake outer membrane protein [Pedobacter ginsengisoli]